MKFFLTPFTMIIWFLVSYLGVYLGLALVLWVFSLSGILLVIGYSFLIAGISALVLSLPALINFVILKLYNLSWFSIIFHSLAGILGVLCFYYSMHLSPLQLFSNNGSTSILQTLWQTSSFKTILLMLPFIGIHLCLIYTGIFNPIAMKLHQLPK
ncbi:hypothetical protein K8352_03540 [Flavobacteriaceae bacterium F89]|uniref:Uncharacterized protein n=1 Tax=Cerina litoralis TaxID=2874477 RepID=A0AAE3JNF0_9FLAO|nr:hypothetical protein [Cerina litoralis]MCG2459809.1 hypothetical protein [Cerina litoralis]